MLIEKKITQKTNKSCVFWVKMYPKMRLACWLFGFFDNHL